MTVRWTDLALDDLDDLHTFVSQDGKSLADQCVERIGTAANHLATSPYMGRKGRVAGTRELIVPPWVIVYRLRQIVEILAVIHSAQRWPDEF